MLEDPARPTGGRTPDPGLVAQNEVFLDAMADQVGQVARMVQDSSWSRVEIEAWAACKPLVDRAYVRRGLYLGDGAWEDLFDALRVPTLLIVPPNSPMAPRQEAVHNVLVRTVVVPGAGHCVRRDQPVRYLRAVDAFLAEVVSTSPSLTLVRALRRLRGRHAPGPRAGRSACDRRSLQTGDIRQPCAATGRHCFLCSAPSTRSLSCC